MNDEFDDMINDAFASSESEAAPEMAWNHIDEELNNITELDGKIKQSFEEVHEKAPDFVWEQIQDQLDIDKVWRSISAKLIDRVSRTYIGYACAVLFLILPFILDHSEKISMSMDVTANSPTLGNLTSVKTDDIVETDIVKVALTESTEIETRIELGTTETSNQINTTIALDVNNSTIKLESKYLKTDILSSQSTQLIQTDNNTPGIAIWKAPTPPGRKRRWIAGLTASFDHTWIIDKDTRAGFKDESLVENKFSIGNSTGVFVEFPIKERFAIHGEYLFQCATRQANQTYVDGTYTLKEKEINAQRLALLASYNSKTKHNWINHSNVVRFGTFFSVITGNSIEHNGNLVELNTLNKRFDFGIQSEVGKRIYFGAFLVEGGIRGDFGFLNLSSPQSEIPKHLNFTREASIGAYLKLGYHF